MTPSCAGPAVMAAYCLQLTSSSLYHSDIRQLACPNLLELRLVECRVQLCAGGSHSGVLHSCPALTRLEVDDCRVLADSVDTPARGVPSTGAQLRHLDLSSCHLQGESRLPPHLASLTHLGVDRNLVPSCLQHISTMVKLEQLHLRRVLEPINTTTLPGIERLTALADLELSDCEVQPACLLPMTKRLTRLRLADVNLNWAGLAPTEQQQQAAAANASQLLQLLARLTALQELTLRDVVGEWPQQLSLFSALTASSKLQRLALHVNIKAAAWTHIFAAGRTLPRLRFLAAFGTDVTGEPFGPVTPADIMCLSSCCPGLQQLSLNAPAVASLALLQPLTALAVLCVYRIEPAAIASLAGLTQLQHLTLSACAPAAAAAEQDTALDSQHLVPLTALMRLTRLDATRPRGAQFAAWELDLLNKAPAGSAPDVWVQLLERYAADPAPRQGFVSYVLQELQQHQEDLAAAGAGTAELCGRVQALEGRLQEVLAALRQPAP